MDAKKTTGKEIAVVSDKELTEMARVGMTKVDPLDIRAPQILLAQKLSDFGNLMQADGEVAKIGEYFHTGKMKILKDFECYFLFAAKTTYKDKRKPEEGEKEQYKVIGAMGDDLSIFGMTFRSSALYALGSLFSVAVSNNKPMFLYRCRVETKTLQNDKGEWLIPVVRVVGEETDQAKKIVLVNLARGFDENADKVLQKESQEDDEGEAGK